MEAATCNQRVEEINAQIQELEERRRSLQEQRSSMDLPELKKDFLNAILTDLKDVVGAVPAPQKKHLRQLLVEKVLVKGQHTIEVWYRLPHFSGVRTLQKKNEPLI